jgi:UDP-GlcNAc:undecaprenyl-phosphate GlcNAc-1-phosphate transferase
MNQYSYLEFKWQIAAFILSVSSAFLMGLSDDAYNTNPAMKFLIQLLCGTLLVLAGIHFQFFSIQLINYALTVIFVVLIMNGMNLIDNMDGISGSVSLVISFNLLLFHFLLNQPFPVLTFVLIGNICTLFVFLFYNIHPSKIYMGDSGSQFQGILISASAVILFSPITSKFYKPDFHYQVLMIILIFLIPVIDVTTVFVQRILRGTSPFVGGKDHTNHALFFRGMSVNKIVLLYVLLQLVACTLSAFFIFHSSPFLFGVSVAYVILLFGVLFYITLLVNPVRKKNANP